MKIISRVLILTFAISLCCDPTPAQGLLWKSFENQAEQMAEKNEDKTAAKLYQSALQEAIKSGDADAKLETLIKLGDCRLRLGENAAAGDSYQQALKLAESRFGADSNQAEFVLIRFGQLDLKQDKIEDADRDLNRALKIENDHPSMGRGNLLKTLADLYAKQNKTVEAEALRREADQLTDSNMMTAPIPLADRTPFVKAVGPRPTIVPSPMARPSTITSGTYAPVPMVRRSSGTSGTYSPTPTRASTSSNFLSDPNIVITPASPVPFARSANTGNSTGAQGDVDFGPYMADLQRRIRKHHFPPKGAESNVVVVVFRIHSGGELSGLNLVGSSGVAIADNAALKAIEDTAPFRPLPTGAPDAINVQFRFDENIHTGHGTGSFRRL